MYLYFLHHNFILDVDDKGGWILENYIMFGFQVRNRQNAVASQSDPASPITPAVGEIDTIIQLSNEPVVR